MAGVLAAPAPPPLGVPRPGRLGPPVSHRPPQDVQRRGAPAWAPQRGRHPYPAARLCDPSVSTGGARRGMQARRGPRSPRTTARDTPLTPPPVDGVPATITALRAALGRRWRPSRPAGADGCRRDGGADRERCGPDLRPRPRRALHAILHGRTAAVGGHRWPCDHGGQEPSADPACRHRRGPQCPPQDTDAGRAARRPDRRPGPDCHVVFPVPHDLGEVVRRHPPALDALLSRAAAPALLTLAAAPHDVGGLSGGLGVRHPWPRTLADHPPGPGVVPAGGVSAARAEWRPARPSSVVPVPALAQRLRGRCRGLGRQDRPARRLPASVWTQGWGVDGTPALPGPAQRLPDLGRSVHRVALPNPRLRSIADHPGCVRAQDSPDPRWKPMTWPAQECSRRFRPPVVPQGVHTVRSEGRWSPVHRPRLHPRQRGLAGSAAAPPPPSPAPAPPATDAWGSPCRPGPRGPSGGQGLRVVLRLLPRYQRGPPCAPAPPCGLPPPGSSGRPVLATVAPCHACALLPAPMAGRARLPHPAALGAHLAAESSPLGPPRWITKTPPTLSRLCFPPGAGCLTIPSGLVGRFRSTALLWRLRATTTLLR
jgi:Putative transposase/Transposase zinc-binding domain